MTDIVMEEGGTVDKYEGDAIIAFWNAPLDVARHEMRTVRAARRALGDDEEAVEGWDQATDLANALSTVLEQVPPDGAYERLGVVVVSTGEFSSAAVVDCDGTSVRGNIINCPADPEHVSLGMRVRLATTSMGASVGSPTAGSGRAGTASSAVRATSSTTSALGVRSAGMRSTRNPRRDSMSAQTRA